MFNHPSLSILAICAKDRPELESFFDYLQSMAHVKLVLEKATPVDLSPYDVVISTDTSGEVNGIDSIRCVRQSSSMSASFFPKTLLNWSMIPQGTPANWCSAR